MKTATLVTITLVVWALAITGHYAIRTWLFLSGSHQGDLYSYSWSFQALTFLIWPFPI